MNIQIAPEEWQAIVREGTRQLQQSGKVTRTKIRDALGMNNYDYEHKIKPVCDKLGWTNAKDKGMTADEWQAMKHAHDYRCLRCGRREPDIKLEPDHVVPRSRGGSDDASNRQPLCRECNNDLVAQPVGGFPIDTT